MLMRHVTAILLLGLLFPATAMAQSLGENLGGSLDASLTSANAFTLSVTPQYPAPFSSVRISPISSTLDLTNATMTVSSGKKQVYSGNAQTVSVPLGGAGNVTTLSIQITSNGVSYAQTIIIQPQDIALVAEPVSSAPPLYPGKPLVPLEGNTRVVAVANIRDASGKTLDPASLSYVWTVENTQVANSSGIGKWSIIVASPLQYRSRNVSVVVQSQNGSLVGGASLTLTANEPTIRIYRNDPLLGILFDRAQIGTHTIAGAEEAFYAAPFSLPLTRGAPLVSWFLNGTPAQTGNILTLRPTGAGQGTAALSVTASTGNSAEASADLSLSFGAKPSTRFFGL